MAISATIIAAKFSASIICVPKLNNDLDKEHCELFSESQELWVAKTLRHRYCNSFSSVRFRCSNIRNCDFLISTTLLPLYLKGMKLYYLVGMPRRAFTATTCFEYKYKYKSNYVTLIWCVCSFFQHLCNQLMVLCKWTLDLNTWYPKKIPGCEAK